MTVRCEVCGVEVVDGHVPSVCPDCCPSCADPVERAVVAVERLDDRQRLEFLRRVADAAGGVTS